MQIVSGLVSALACALVISLVACSGSSTSGGAASGCTTVCDCVAGKGGDRTTCTSQCNQMVAAGDDQSDCESTLASNGFSSCKSTCQAFATTPASSSGGSTVATLSDFCDKCATCVGTDGFGEGFCDPFIGSSGSFDTASCRTEGDPSHLSDRTVTKSQLSNFTCTEFDDAE